MMKSDDLARRIAQHQQSLQTKSLADICNGSPHRYTEFSLEAAGLFLDFSKQICNSDTLGLFEALAESRQLRAHIGALFTGEIVNRSEHRPALHTSLRSSDVNAPNYAEVRQAQAHMQRLVAALHTGQLLGFSGKPYTDVVNIGIGGSDLGPRFVVTALRAFSHDRIRVHFVANVDPNDLADTLATLNPETTLFIAASKSFTTLETRANTLAARRWLAASAGGRSINHHFVAITANTAKACEFGIPATQILPMWDWVGGRYSLWSAIGLPIAIAIGWESFATLLRGAEAMDRHYREAPFAANMPALLGLFEWWYATYWNAQSALVLPYSHRLRLFPAFLQQLSMESLGKSVDVDGHPIADHTGLVIWGEPGTNSQHSFMQLMHQGTRMIPVDFIAVVGGDTASDERNAHLYANCLSQSRVLMTGKSLAQVEQELAASGIDPIQIAALAPHKVQSGNRPSNTILLETLTCERLGALIALYEHKVFTQSVLWNINAFDQWGVEMGKQGATTIFAALNGEQTPELDASTHGLIERFKTRR